MPRPSIHLIRHADAGSRAHWNGDDEHRPLSDRGEHQAKRIADALDGAGIDLLWSSTYQRCRQTLEPLGVNLGLPVEDQLTLTEGARGPDALDVLLEAAAAGRTVAACSHGDVIPALIAAAVRRGARLDGSSSPKKAGRYECAVVDGQIATIIGFPPPDEA